MNYSAALELREQGFPEEDIWQMLELRSLVDDYFRGNVEYTTVLAALRKSKKEAWFPFAYLDGDLPEDPTTEKWFQEMDFDPLPVMRKLDVPVLLIYGEQDPWVPIAQSIARSEANGPKDLSIHQIQDANHFMISIAHAGIRGDEGPLVAEYAAILTRWLKRQVM